MRQNTEIWKGAVAGLVGGLIATWVMTQFQNASVKLVQSATGSEDESQESSEPATVKAASAISEAVMHRPLTDENKAAAGQAVHYGFGTMNGLIYGALAEALPVAAAGGGALFGTALWLAADEVAVPAAGLSKPPREQPASTHAQALAAHVVYGATAEVVRRQVRDLLA